jgi:ABC-type glycerol-3-phosphate transport system substrate-binding protein
MHNKGIGRRTVLAASLAAPAAGLARPAIAQPKPDKLVLLVPTGHWPLTIAEDVTAAFTKETGIRVEVTTLPVDALNARMKAEFAANSGGIDITMYPDGWAGWVAPHLEDHAALMRRAGERAAQDFNFADILPSAQRMSAYGGKQIGIPYRVTMVVVHYQPHLLAEAGIAAPPRNFAEFTQAALALTKAGAPSRFGVGIIGRQGPGIIPSFSPWLFSNGGKLLDEATLDIHVNEPAAVEALDYYGALMTRHKVIPPEALTWEFDEIVAGGQNDRYAMTATYAPYGTAMNDPKQSKTGGKWTAVTMPGATSAARGRSWIGGWTIAVPTSSRLKEHAFHFVQMATGAQWMARSLERGNLPPRASVLKDPAVGTRFPWTPAAATAMETAILIPSLPIYPTLESQLRPAISEVLLGQRSAKAALDAVASDWQRTLRRAGLKR